MLKYLKYFAIGSLVIFIFVIIGSFAIMLMGSAAGVMGRIPQVFALFLIFITIATTIGYFVVKDEERANRLKKEA
jgi:hypothetical protein